MTEVLSTSFSSRSRRRQLLGAATAAGALTGVPLASVSTQTAWVRHGADARRNGDKLDDPTPSSPQVQGRR